MDEARGLDPSNRRLYGEILRPPPGYEIDAALATTYTLDFETALVIPATLAFHAAESRQQTLDTPLALLEGLERLAPKIAIFCEAGRIKAVPTGASRLTALLEDTVTEVIAPGGGAFHPKLWVLRFAPMQGNGPTRLRVALLSRNLTTDTSWDLSLCLDEDPEWGTVADNSPLTDLLLRLPRLTVGRRTAPAAAAMADSLAADLAEAKWSLPEHVRNVSFAVNGLGGKSWMPRVGKALGIISPFASDKALARLTRGLASEATYLLGRSEELVRLAPETLACFGAVHVLDELAETEDGDELEEQSRNEVPARGLHAKAFITERYSSTEITLGSGNATDNALLTGNNVEVFATLSGYTRHLGTAQEQLAPERLGRYLRPFELYEPDEDASEDAADRLLEDLQRGLAKCALTLKCEEAPDQLIALNLSAASYFSLPESVQLEIWPLVSGANSAARLTEITVGPRLLRKLPLRDVTRWLGVRLTHHETRLEKDFTLGAELVNLPDARTAEILRSIIENQDAFLAYIRLLLGDVSDAAKALFASGSGGIFSGNFSTPGDAPLLEDMVRALCGDGRQLGDIERLVQRLSNGETEDSDVIPEDFLVLWKTFRQVIQQEGKRHG